MKLGTVEAKNGQIITRTAEGQILASRDAMACTIAELDADGDRQLVAADLTKEAHALAVARLSWLKGDDAEHLTSAAARVIADPDRPRRWTVED
jgi:hypothetical protein